MDFGQKHLCLRTSRSVECLQQTVPQGMQVSEHTGRAHLHESASGEQPLSASLPLDALLPATQPYGWLPLQLRSAVCIPQIHLRSEHNQIQIHEKICISAEVLYWQ